MKIWQPMDGVNGMELNKKENVIDNNLNCCSVIFQMDIEWENNCKSIKWVNRWVKVIITEPCYGSLCDINVM